MSEVAIVVTGEPIEAARKRRGGYPELIESALGSARHRLVTLDARAGALGTLTGYAAVIVTGSASSVTEDSEWIRSARARLREAVSSGVAILGICFGHQLLGQALGGRVTNNPRGREIGTVPMRLLAEDPLLEASQRPFLVNMTHCDSVVELPPGARVIGSTELDPNAAVRFAPRAWGVQFHPEIDREVMLDYVEGRSHNIIAEGLDLEAIRRAVAEAAGGRAVLARFLRTIASEVSP